MGGEFDWPQRTPEMYVVHQLDTILAGIAVENDVRISPVELTILAIVPWLCPCHFNAPDLKPLLHSCPIKLFATPFCTLLCRLAHQFNLFRKEEERVAELPSRFLIHRFHPSHLLLGAAAVATCKAHHKIMSTAVGGDAHAPPAIRTTKEGDAMPRRSHKTSADKK